MASFCSTNSEGIGFCRLVRIEPARPIAKRIRLADAADRGRE
jgi:hypothetical protein